jgi:hypothetical protein
MIVAVIIKDDDINVLNTVLWWYYRPSPAPSNTIQDQKNMFVIFTSLSTQYYDDCHDHWYYDLSSDAAEEKI